jgi:branched-chain amino acid transport system permease protein
MAAILAYSGAEAAQNVVHVLSLGSVYALLGLGVAVVYSVLGLINFAHGELVTLSGLMMFLLRIHDVPWPVVVPVAILTGGVAAVAMERVAFRPVRGAPPTTLLLTSLGLAIIIQNVLLLTLSSGARSNDIRIGSWSYSTFHIGSVYVQWLDVATVLTTIVTLLLLTMFLRHSVRGLALRAAAEDFTMTRMMGIRADTVIMLAFLVSGLLAGIAAFFYIGTLGQVGYNYGFTPLLKGFIAAVIGGLGSLSGAVAGGFILAALEIFFTVTLPAENTPFSGAIVFAMVIVVLLFRPQGLFAGRGAGTIERV